MLNKNCEVRQSNACPLPCNDSSLHLKSSCWLIAHPWWLARLQDGRTHVGSLHMLRGRCHWCRCRRRQRHQKRPKKVIICRQRRWQWQRHHSNQHNCHWCSFFRAQAAFSNHATMPKHKHDGGLWLQVRTLGCVVCSFQLHNHHVNDCQKVVVWLIVTTSSKRLFCHVIVTSCSIVATSVAKQNAALQGCVCGAVVVQALEHRRNLTCQCNMNQCWFSKMLLDQSHCHERNRTTWDNAACVIQNFGQALWFYMGSQQQSRHQPARHRAEIMQKMRWGWMWIMTMKATTTLWKWTVILTTRIMQMLNKNCEVRQSNACPLPCNDSSLHLKSSCWLIAHPWWLARLQDGRTHVGSLHMLRGRCHWCRCRRRQRHQKRPKKVIICRQRRWQWQRHHSNQHNCHWCSFFRAQAAFSNHATMPKHKHDGGLWLQVRTLGCVVCSFQLHNHHVNDCQKVVVWLIVTTSSKRLFCHVIVTSCSIVATSVAKQNAALQGCVCGAVVVQALEHRRNLTCQCNMNQCWFSKMLLDQSHCHERNRTTWDNAACVIQNFGQALWFYMGSQQQSRHQPARHRAEIEPHGACLATTLAPGQPLLASQPPPLATGLATHAGIAHAHLMSFSDSPEQQGTWLLEMQCCWVNAKLRNLTHSPLLFAKLLASAMAASARIWCVGTGASSL